MSCWIEIYIFQTDFKQNVTKRNFSIVKLHQRVQSF